MTTAVDLQHIMPRHSRLKEHTHVHLTVAVSTLNSALMRSNCSCSWALASRRACCTASAAHRLSRRTATLSLSCTMRTSLMPTMTQQ